MSKKSKIIIYGMLVVLITYNIFLMGQNASLKNKRDVAYQNIKNAEDANLKLDFSAFSDIKMSNKITKINFDSSELILTLEIKKDDNLEEIKNDIEEKTGLETVSMGSKIQELGEDKDAMIAEFKLAGERYE